MADEDRVVAGLCAAVVADDPGRKASLVVSAVDEHERIATPFARNPVKDDTCSAHRLDGILVFARRARSTVDRTPEDLEIVRPRVDLHAVSMRAESATVSDDLETVDDPRASPVEVNRIAVLPAHNDADELEIDRAAAVPCLAIQIDRPFENIRCGSLCVFGDRLLRPTPNADEQRYSQHRKRTDEQCSSQERAGGKSSSFTHLAAAFVSPWGSAQVLIRV